MATSQHDQAKSSSWSPGQSKAGSSQFDTRLFGEAEAAAAQPKGAASQFDSRPFGVVGGPGGATEIQAKQETSESGGFDLSGVSVFAGGNAPQPPAAPWGAAVPSVQREVDEEALEALEERETGIQRKCEVCGGDDDGNEKPGGIQTKLTIGQPGDKYEQEADAVAAQVVERINSPQSHAVSNGAEASVQRREVAEQPSVPNITLMRKGEGGTAEAGADVEARIERSRGQGQPLGDGVRAPMEQAFGADFSGVRIHADGESDQLNRAVQAKAFTTKQDIFFRQGEYQPGNRGGQELLAHELTHVVQQTGTTQKNTLETSTQKKQLQRQDNQPLSGAPNYHLTPPSLGGSLNQTSRYSLTQGAQLELDPEVLAMAEQCLSQNLNPAVIRAGLSQLHLGVPTASNAGAMPGMSNLNPNSAAASPRPLVPAGEGPETPRTATAGDLMNAVLAVPTIGSAITHLQTQATRQLRRNWKQAGTAEQIGAVSSVAVIGAGVLGSIFANPTAREFALSQLNGQVLPVPGLDWMRVEFNTADRNLMIGLHVDIGSLLPDSLGFGSSSSRAMGAPPRPEPLEPNSSRESRVQFKRQSISSPLKGQDSFHGLIQASPTKGNETQSKKNTLSVTETLSSPQIQRWALPTDWLDYAGLAIDVVERAYIELAYEEGDEKDFHRFVNTFFFVVDAVLAALPAAGGGGLAMRGSRQLAAAGWGAIPSSVQAEIIERLAREMGWSTTRVLQMLHVFMMSNGSGRGSGGGTPGNNRAQNRQFRGAVQEIERRIGRRLSKAERRTLHDEITGQGHGYHEIVEIGIDLFGG